MTKANYRYVTVDSRHRRMHEDTSEISVELSNPIQNAVSVSCISFSTPNEIYNITKQNNTFILQPFSITAGSPHAQNIDSEKTYTLPLGLYTLIQIVALMNEAIEASPIEYYTVGFELLASNKTSVSVSCTGTQKKFICLYHKNEISFYSSLFHRLGFARNQIASGNVNMIREEGSSVNLVKHQQDDYKEFTLQDVNTFNIFNIMSCNDNEILYGNFIGFESATSFMKLKCDLIHDMTTSVLNDDKSIVSTKSDNTMQHININVNIFSYIHYNASPADAIKHNLSNQTIRRFKLTLTDDNDNVFQLNHFKDFSAIICFEIEEEQSILDINRDVLLTNQRMGYKSRHM